MHVMCYNLVLVYKTRKEISFKLNGERETLEFKRFRISIMNIGYVLNGGWGSIGMVMVEVIVVVWWQ